jgi:hypothetical protein
MREVTYSGPIPEHLDVRLERRDTSPLPPDALVKFQMISRSKRSYLNYRWVLYEDGRWFLARHSGADIDWQIPFDTDLPSTPTRRLPARVVDRVRKQLQDNEFLDQPPYLANKLVKDGDFFVVTARSEGRVHEVIYEAVSPPPVDYLATFVSTYK